MSYDSRRGIGKSRTPTVPGKESPYRNRSVEENLDLFARMKTANSKKVNVCCVQK